MALADSSRTLERIHDDDVRLLQRINAVAAELHRLWAADRPTDTEQPRRSGAALQKEIDELYERRRQLVAERALLGKTPRHGRRQGWAGSVDLAA